MAIWKPTQDPEDIYLAHHGILGQKWGKRNGPPYPLSANAHSSAEKKAGYKKSIKKSGEVKSQDKHGFINPVAVAVISYDALVLGTLLGRVVSKTAKDHSAKKFRQKKDKEREECVTDEKTGLKLQNNPYDDKSNLKSVNPDYRLDPSGARQNCTNCTMAFEMRKRGYEVEAKLKSSGRNGVEFAKDLFPKSENKIVQMWPDRAKDEDAFLRYMNKNESLARNGKNKEIAKKAISQLKTEEPGSRGQLLMTWGRFGGHSVIYQITDKGKVQILDGQSNKIYNEKEAEKLLARTVAVQYQRLDNVEFDPKKIKEAVR